MLFKVKPTNISPEKGKILIAAPMSRDKFFRRSIVLIGSNQADGAVGFVLNNYVSVSLSKLLDRDINFDANVSLGGPVARNRLDYIHCLGDKIPDSKHLVDNIFWGGNFDVVVEFMNTGILKKNQIKFFIGHSGWSKGQLDNEIANDLWLVYNAKSDTVLEKDTNYWRNTLRRMGKQYSTWLNLPIDPQLN